MKAMRARRSSRAALATGLLISVLSVVTGCGIQIPSDPDGTLDRLTNGVLRAGASVSGQLVREEDGRVTGSEVTVIEGFAKSQSAEVTWTIGNEETLVGLLESGELDIVAGGMTSDTPWADRAGVTRGYSDLQGSNGRPLVFLVPLGENRFLSALESYLDDEMTK